MSSLVPATRARRRSLAGLSALALATLLVFASPRAATAHLYLKAADPEPGSTVKEPDRVELEFSEPVDLGTASINVLDSEGRRVDRGQVRRVGDDPYSIQISLTSTLQNGRYTVIWRLVAQDGHPRTERFRFRLRAPAPLSPTPSGEMGEGAADDEMAAPGHGAVEEPDIGASSPVKGSHLGSLAGVLQGIGKFFVFASLLALTGLVGFLLLVWRRPSGLPPHEQAEVEDRFTARWRRPVVLAWFVAVLASLATLVLQAAILADVPLSGLRPALLADVLDTRFGQTTLWRLGLLVFGAVLWVAGRRIVAAPPMLRPRGRNPAPVAEQGVGAPSVLAWGSAPFVVALLVTVSLAGHAGSAPPLALNLSADVLHLLAAGAWLGGLAALLVVGFPSTGRLDEVHRCRVLAPLIVRFSNLAVVAIVVLVASGVVRSLVELQGLDDLTSSYGWVLLTKVGVFVPILVLGAVNNRRTKPACVRAASARVSTPALGTLRRLIILEVALGILVVGIAAVLVNLSPPRTMEGGPGLHALLSI